VKSREENRALIAATIIAIILQIPIFWFIALQTKVEKGPQVTRRTLSPISGLLIPQTPKKKKKHEPVPKGQVVSLPDEIRSKEVPKKAKYLSRFDTKVKKQTRARHSSRHRKPRHSRPARRVSRVQSPNSKSLARTKLEKKQASRMENNRKVPMSEKGVLFRGDRVLRGLRNVMLPNREPSVNTNIQSTVGRYSSNDAVLDQPKADETLLNSRHFRYWAFFQRVKEQVEAQWKPSDAIMEWDPKMEHTGRNDRLTILKVTIDKEGRLLRSEVIHDSGLAYLNREALRAFKAAQPYVNPPEGMFDKHGRLTFTFGFLVEMSGGPVRFFWRP